MFCSAEVLPSPERRNAIWLEFDRDALASDADATVLSHQTDSANERYAMWYATPGLDHAIVHVLGDGAYEVYWTPLEETTLCTTVRRIRGVVERSGVVVGAEPGSIITGCGYNGRSHLRVAGNGTFHLFLEEGATCALTVTGPDYAEGSPVAVSAADLGTITLEAP